MNKHTFRWNGKEYFFLGLDEYGKKQYLELATFDCGWYLGIGCIETFTNNSKPHLSRDIASLTHWDSMFEKAQREGFYHIDAFNHLFVESPFSEKEKWTILELMASLYTAHKYAEMLYSHGAHITTNPCGKIITNGIEYRRINEIVIPKMLEALYKILTP